MADIRKILLNKFESQKRFENFGNMLNKIEIHGFRGIRELSIDFDFPITAISGFNGTGKSTIGQLAICAYNHPKENNKKTTRSYIKDYFPVSNADQTVIDDKAKVIYTYNTNTGKDTEKSVTVFRDSKESRWRGYQSQPPRKAYYIGFTVYIPKVERKDFSIYGAKHLKFPDNKKRDISPEIIKRMSIVIGNKYENIIFRGITHKSKEAELGTAQRFGISYSENNMGFGEGRILYTMDLLENAPDKSLFILEEPETSLHENAQYEFSKYLLDVCNRKGHQIILSTHSSAIISALPKESRKLLSRDEKGVKIESGISSMQIGAILSNGYNKNLDIYVEDEFAKLLLLEALRIKAPELINCINIHPVGGVEEIKSAMRVLNRRENSKDTIAILDPDMKAIKSENILVLPGEHPPEKEVFLKEDIRKFISEKYNLSIEKVDLILEQTTDHHKYSHEISKAANIPTYTLESFVIDKYMEISKNEFVSLISEIKQYIK